MPTLADRLRKEGEEIGVKIGEKRGVKIGEKRGVKIGEEIGKRETARKLIARGVDINVIAEATGFPRQEIEKLAESVH